MDQEIDTEPESSKPQKKDSNPEKSAKKSIMEQVNLKVSIKWQNQIPLTRKEKEEIKDVLKVMDKEDKIRQLREEARNELESFIYSSREIGYESKFEAFSTSEERETLSKAVNEASEWMEDHEIDGTKEEFSKKLENLKSLADPIFLRTKEDSLRPLAVTEFEAILKKCKKIMEEFEKDLKEDSPLKTKSEKVSKILEITENWYKTTSKSQSELTPLQNPVLLSSDLKGRIEMLERTFVQIQALEAAKDLELKRKKQEEKKKSTSAASTETPKPEPESPEEGGSSEEGESSEEPAENSQERDATDKEDSHADL